MLLYMCWSGLSQAQVVQSIPFIWSNDELSGVSFEKTAMHIPVKFSHDTVTYYFQFDTGANKSYLYTGPKSIPQIIDKIDIGVELMTSIGMVNLRPAATNSTYSVNGKTFIGTIGSDFLAGKTIEINFIEQSINVLSGYTESDYHLEEMALSRGRPMIDLIIRGKKHFFLYDTGSSLFDLWTTKPLWRKWKEDGSDIQMFPISSWGKNYISSRCLLNKSNIDFSPFSQKMKYVWYSSNKRFKKIFRQSKSSGLIGNRPFLDHILILDFKSKKRGLKRST